MVNALADFGDGESKKRPNLTAGGALRHKLFNKITPILLASDRIPDSRNRLVVQACCLDIVTALEDLIRDYGLDSCDALVDEPKK